jgi:hypothetical protein
VSLAAAAVTLTACPGSLNDPGAFTFPDASPDSLATAGVSCGTVVASLFSGTCSITGCHASNIPAGNVNLQSPDAYSRLRGQAAADGGGFIIAPDGSVTGSVLYQVLSGDPNPPGGFAMPLGGSVDTATLRCVEEWIADKGDIPDSAAADAGSD